MCVCHCPSSFVKLYQGFWRAVAWLAPRIGRIPNMRFHAFLAFACPSLIVGKTKYLGVGARDSPKVFRCQHRNWAPRA